jgi:hypothetical protein
MLTDRDFHYHVQRARAELDLAYRAPHQRAADAHMKLSALHMHQIKQADEACGGAECSPKA